MAKDSSAQGATVASPWSTDRSSLGRPKSMGADGAQGDQSMYRRVTQGKFSGDARFASNSKQAGPGAAVGSAWPNKGTVYKPRVR